MARCIVKHFILRVCATTLLIGASPAVAIVNGERVSDPRFAAEFPWAVVIGKKDSQQLCGGALIAPQWVVTAAHCAHMGRFVVYGHASRYVAERVEVRRAIRHPEFSTGNWQFDIGLLELAEPVPATAIATATAAQARLLLKPQAAAVLAGWGKTGTRNKPVARLVTSRIRLADLVVERSQFLFRSESGPCASDSGGPLIMTTAAGDRLLVGVASRTDGNLCSKRGGIAIYTRLDSAQSFIDEFVSLTPETPDSVTLEQ